jgi:DNA-binding response OmpR family regulator
MVLDVLSTDFEKVIQAADGQEAVDAAELERPDLVLLDFEMPRMNGLEACRRILALPGRQDIPIVMLTTRDSEDDVKEAFTAGASDYLVKPFAPGQLRARLRVWLLRSEKSPGGATE